MTKAEYSSKGIETMSGFHKKKHRDTCCIAPKIKYHEDKSIFSPISDGIEASNIKTFITKCRNCEKVEFFNIVPVRL